MTRPVSIEAWLADVDPALRPALDRLRAVVQAAHPGLVESIKWNAPSFAYEGEDRVTLGLERGGGLRVVLHRGAAVRNADDFSFDDDTGLASWPARDRGVVSLPDEAAVIAEAYHLSRLVRRWIDATA